jgi:hypothetical protein
MVTVQGAGNPLVDAGVASLVGDSLVFEEYYRMPTATLEAAWVVGDLSDADSAGHTAQWTRITSVRQYAYVDDGTGHLVMDPTPLPAGTPLENIDIKEIVVEVLNARGPGPLTAGKSLSVRAFKSQ